MSAAPEVPAQADATVGMDFLQSLPRRWVVTYIPLGIFVFVLLFPFYWMAEQPVFK